MNRSNFYEFQLNHNKMMSLPRAREPRIRKLAISSTVTEVILPQIELKNKLPTMRAQHKNEKKQNKKNGPLQRIAQKIKQPQTLFIATAGRKY